MQWNYDYSRTLWMKMYLAEPKDFERGLSEVFITFEQALEIIRAIDAMTQGIRKIIYLVGWQGLGHDDCYPEMEVVNEALKRDCDATARDSLWWLFEEAKRYHTVVSFHGNLADAYRDTPCFPELAATNSLANGKDGKPAVIENFNGRDAFKVSYKGFYESGLFKRLWDRFCEVTPVREAGTVHLDNFCIAQSLNPYTSVTEQAQARNKMLDYIASLGIDVTSEYTYRELEWRADSPEHPIRPMLYASAVDPLPDGDWRDAPMHTLGRIPATWWTSNVTVEESMKIPASLYSGRLTDAKQKDVFYGAMHGEEIWRKYGNDPADWYEAFLYEFCTMQLPYFYLNRHERLRLHEADGAYIVDFSGGIVSDGRTKSILENGVTRKEGDDVLLPLDEKNTTFIAYSKNGKDGVWNIPHAPFRDAAVFRITPAGNVPCGTVGIADGTIALKIEPGQAMVIRAAD